MTRYDPDHDRGIGVTIVVFVAAWLVSTLAACGLGAAVAWWLNQK